MKIYNLQKNELQHLLVNADIPIVYYSPLNSFIEDFEIETQLNSEYLLQQMQQKNIFPAPDDLASALRILKQPDAKIDLVSNIFGTQITTVFARKQNKFVEFYYDIDGNSIIQTPVDAGEFIRNISTPLAQKSHAFDIKKEKINFVLTYPEYIVMVAIAGLLKDNTILADIDEEVEINPKSIAEYIKTEEQFAGMLLLTGLEILDLEDFLTHIDSQVAVVVNNLINKSYVRVDANGKIVLSDFLQVFVDFNTWKINRTVFSIQNFDTENPQDVQVSSFSILCSPNYCYSIDFDGNTLQFKSLTEKDDLLEYLSQKLVDKTNAWEKITADISNDNGDIYCSNCGKPISANANFCVYCGNKLK